MSHCNNCGCSKVTCGCKDSYLTSAPVFPTPEDCPAAQPCSDITNSQCVVYTQTPILCGQTTIVDTDDTLSQILTNIVAYVCNQLSTIETVVVEGGGATQVTSNTVGNVTTYTVITETLKKFVVSSAVSPVSTIINILRSSLNGCGIFNNPACNTAGVPFATDFIINIYVYNEATGIWRKLDGANGVTVDVDSGPGDITITIPTTDPNHSFYRVVIIG